MQAYKQSWTQLYVKKNYILHQINKYLSVPQQKQSRNKTKEILYPKHSNHGNSDNCVQMVLELSSMIEVVPVQVDGEDNSSWLDVHAMVFTMLMRHDLPPGNLSQHKLQHFIHKYKSS